MLRGLFGQRVEVRLQRLDLILCSHQRTTTILRPRQPVDLLGHARQCERRVLSKIGEVPLKACTESHEPAITQRRYLQAGELRLNVGNGILNNSHVILAELVCLLLCIVRCDVERAACIAGATASPFDSRGSGTLDAQLTRQCQFMALDRTID